jgi:3,4-dihydroxy 2-butanone 4-phosphate synthase / GTP cyclohydrolase II
MQLTDWLEREKMARGLTREEFARRIGRHPSLITQICDGAWVTRETALAIARVTDGEVTPNDLAGIEAPAASAAVA